ncbi:MAG: nprS [Firmicutes bacterium]|nr:nprS [Bacillota bacterium]
MNISPFQQDLLEDLRQRDPNLLANWNNDTESIVYLRGNLSNLNRTSPSIADRFINASKFLSKYHPLFGINNLNQELTKNNVVTDRLGMVHLSLQQKFENVPVEGGMVSLHYSATGLLQTVFNKFVPDLRLNTTPALSYAEAKYMAASHAGLNFSLNPAKPELFILTNNSVPSLCWQVKLFRMDTPIPECWLYAIDAITGEVVRYHSTLHRITPVKGWGIGYYSRGGEINTSRDDNGTYLLYDQSRHPNGPIVETYSYISGQLSKTYNNLWNRIKVSTRNKNQGPEVDAHRYAGYVVDYYFMVHGRNSFDDKGSNVKIVVHSDETYWTSEHKFISISDNDNDTHKDFGSTFHTLAHEFTHGVTNAGFAPFYCGESGVLSEALSDCFAAFITGNWYYAEDTWLLNTHGMRNLTNPTNNGRYNPNNPQESIAIGNYPDHYSDRYQYQGQANEEKCNIEVHCNSTIISHAIYLLSNGGLHRKTKIKVPRLGINIMETLLYNVQAYQLIGCSHATFLDFRQALINACHDIYPCDQKKIKAIESAFNAVGIIPDKNTIYCIQ